MGSESGLSSLMGEPNPEQSKRSLYSDIMLSLSSLCGSVSSDFISVVVGTPRQETGGNSSSGIINLCSIAYKVGKNYYQLSGHTFAAYTRNYLYLKRDVLNSQSQFHEHMHNK